MLEIYNICQELQATTKKLEKESILKREIDNEEFKQFIKYVLDPMYIYGLQSKKVEKFLGSTDGESEFKDLFSLFEYLLKNNTGRDSDAQKVAQFIDSEKNQEMKEFCIKAITKTLRLGIDSTVNKIWGRGFLNKFELMLAKDFHKESHKLKGRDFFLTEKLDGSRLAVVIKDGNIKAFTRQGKPVTELIEIEEEMKNLPEGVYDGEILVKNEDSYKDRAVLQETLKISRKDGIKTGLNFHVFDYLTNEEFENRQSIVKYSNRRKYLERLFNQNNFQHIHLLPVLYYGNDLEVIPDMLKRLEDDGKEGLMLNVADDIYSCKRTNSILKIKTMKFFDEECTGIFEGEGKYESMLGGITVNYKGHELRVGSGFTDEQRKAYFNKPSSIVGSIVEIQYFRESQNQHGGLSVSFPVFQGIREDKSESSYH